MDPDIQRLERELADKLGAKVVFQHTASGKGKLVVSYNSLDELEGILGHIQHDHAERAKISRLKRLDAGGRVSL